MFYLAGALLILAGILSFLLDSPPVLERLVHVGWIIWAVAMVLIFSSMWALRRKGKPLKGKDWTHTSVLVDSGVFAVVRHPLYLGWLLVYVAVMLFSRHWLTMLVATPGIACVCTIAGQEDQRLIEKFGPSYGRYMQSVPGINLFAGLIRLLRRRGERPDGGSDTSLGRSPEDDRE